MIELNEYFNKITDKSKFPCSLGSKGGFINFQNSGQRGSVKEFTLSLESILSGLKDIKNNLSAFQGLTRYVEKDWRDHGARFFNDLILNSMITVQTKPCFTTFSKIINWANEVEYSLYDDNQIDLSEKAIDITIEKLENLSILFTPSVPEHSTFNSKLQKKSFSVPLSKPFLLLAGISGTGKTRFVREQAKATNQFSETYCLTSVRPDWHEPSDLLGYISRLNGNAEYVTTDVLQFIGKAWRGIADSGLTITAQNIDEQGKCLVVNGDSESLNGLLPYWLCLDEMNLAPVEQYFADYLSVLETREWCWGSDNFTYRCDALLKPSVLSLKDKDGNIDTAYNTQLRNSLGFEESKYNDLWSLICKFGLSIPFNLMVAGTVNMDETTHGFSRKVIDRALTFDFGEFFPNDYNQFFSPENNNKTLSFPIYSHAKKEHLSNTVDSAGQRSINFLTAVNEVLANTPFQLAYRALNELLLAVISANPQDEPTLKAVWDDFLMCKVLPRIEGDMDKLGNEPSLLEQLKKVLAEDQLSDIWHQEKESATARPDLFREQKEGADDAAKVIRIGCRSKAKITWMQTRLSNASFTSFWP